MATLLKKVVVVSPDVGVYTAVVIGGTKSAKGSPNLLACHLYVIVLAPDADSTFVKGGSVSFSHIVNDDCPIVPLVVTSL